MERQTVLDLLFGEVSKRSRQAEVGPSEIGGCKRRVWHRLQRTPVTNTSTVQLPALLGTAVHSLIESKVSRDGSFMVEVAVERDGLRGHVDVYDPINGEVIDWKTSTLRNIGYFPSEQQRWQVQLYGWLLSGNGYRVDTVTLVFIPRDGTEADIRIHSEPYDEGIAGEALAWLQDVKDSVGPPEPGKRVSFCSKFCPYFDRSEVVGCPGKR